MNKYLEAEKRLAELLHPDAELDYNIDGKLYAEWFTDGKRSKKFMPMWARDWNACGPLMTDHGDINIGIAHTSVAISGTKGVIVMFADHPDRNTAVRYAIVLAAIAKLEAAQEKDYQQQQKEG